MFPPRLLFCLFCAAAAAQAATPPVLHLTLRATTFEVLQRNAITVTP